LREYRWSSYRDYAGLEKMNSFLDGEPIQGVFQFYSSRSYGSAGGARAVEQLRLTDFQNFSVFKPAPQHEKSFNELFEQVIAWSSALKALR
jgi:hypothetical protein